MKFTPEGEVKNYTIGYVLYGKTSAREYIDYKADLLNLLVKQARAVFR